MSTSPDTSPTQSLDSVRAAYSQWRATVEAELKGAPFDKKLISRTFEGIALQPVYTRLDVDGLGHLASQPGQAPFVRGFSKTGYTSGAWEFCQEIHSAKASDFNCAVLKGLMAGQNSVALTPDRAARAGSGPDAGASGVGVDGVSIADLADLSAALKDVAVTAVPVHLRVGANALPLAALYLAFARKSGADASKLTGSLTADPLGEWLEQGALPASLPSLYDALAAWTKAAATQAPELATIGVNVAPVYEAGGNAVQELAYAIAAGAEYLRELTERKVTAKKAVARMRFSFSVGPQFFLETAKFRAFRALWTRVASGFEVSGDAARVRIHAQTGRWDKTVLDPHVNMLRVTTEAFSAVLGGVDSLHIGTYDEVLGGGGDDISQRIARNLHTLLAEEFHTIAPADPAGGSWFVEKTTDELARKAWALFQEIEKKGGLSAALREGFFQKLVAATSAEKDDAASKRRLGLLGTNLFPNLKEKPAARPAFDAAAFASARQAEVAARAAAATKLTAKSKFDALVEAADQGATISQISKAISAVPAEASITPLAARRAAEGFEALRAIADDYTKKNGSRPKIFLAKIGPVKQHKPRADFSAGFFSVGGFEATGKEAFETAEAAAQAAAASGAPIAVLCSTDDTYPVLVPAFASALKAAKPGMIAVLAGIPAEPATVEAFKKAGIDEFIHIRANVRDLLAKLLKQIGA